MIITISVLIGAIFGGLIMTLLIASSDFKMTELNSKEIFNSYKVGYKAGISECAYRVSEMIPENKEIICDVKDALIGGVDDEKA